MVSSQLGLFGMHAARILSQSGYSCRTLKSIKLFASTFVRGFADAVKGRLYSDKHEWVEVNGSVGTVGISQYAQEALGDVVFAQLPDIGTDITKDDEVGALESVKAASEVFSPVSGKVTEKNTQVENVPSLVNESCYEKGWLFKVSLTNLDELKGLMSEEEYKKFLTSDQVH